MTIYQRSRTRNWSNFEFSSDGQTVTSAGATATRTFTVTTNTGTWKAESSDETWLTVDIQDDNKTFVLDAEENTNVEPRQPATVIVTAGDAEPWLIAVTQKGSALIPVTGIDVSGNKLVEGKLSMEKGETALLIATLLPHEYNEPGADNTLVWGTDKPAVATVTNGTITAEGSGNAVITVSLQRNPSIKKDIPVTGHCA